MWSATLTLSDYGRVARHPERCVSLLGLRGNRHEQSDGLSHERQLMEQCEDSDPPALGLETLRHAARSIGCADAVRK